MATKVTPEQKAADGKELSDKDVVALRTEPGTAPTNLYRKTYVVQTQGLASDGSGNEDMHEANKVATLQEALNRGLHPTEAAKLEDTEDDGRGSTRFTYSVPVVPAARHEVSAETYTPTRALNDLGGTTMVENVDAQADAAIRESKGK